MFCSIFGNTMSIAWTAGIDAILHEVHCHWLGYKIAPNSIEYVECCERRNCQRSWKERMNERASSHTHGTPYEWVSNVKGSNKSAYTYVIHDPAMVVMLMILYFVYGWASNTSELTIANSKHTLDKKKQKKSYPKIPETKWSRKYFFKLG